MAEYLGVTNQLIKVARELFNVSAGIEYEVGAAHVNDCAPLTEYADWRTVMRCGIK